MNGRVERVASIILDDDIDDLGTVRCVDLFDRFDGAGNAGMYRASETGFDAADDLPFQDRITDFDARSTGGSDVL